MRGKVLRDVWRDGPGLAFQTRLAQQGRMKDVQITDVTGVDPANLADIRAEAMRPSLTAVDRFDPARARARFLDHYVPSDTFVIRAGPEVIGFYVLRRRPDHLYLDHLYIRPEHQGDGLGRRIVTAIQNQARDAVVALRLMALLGSPANDFYVACGFRLDRCDDLDAHYVWRAT